VIDDFIIRAWLAGVGVAIIAGPLGCFVVWRRMAYFGDTMAHSALLGVALGFVLGVDPAVGIIVVSLAAALMLLALRRTDRIADDTLLGILSHATLSLGLVVLSLLVWLRIDLIGYLFGDVLAVTSVDLAWIYGGGAVVLALLIWIWRPLLALTINEELARAEGVPAWRTQFVYMALIAATIAIAMKIVGILLITSLLIIPAAAARRLANTPEQMAVAAALAGALACSLGLWGSLTLDTPSGPSVVVAAVGLFALSLVPTPRYGGTDN
jgi:zinc transport system permease protein